MDRKTFILKGDLKKVMWETSWPAVAAIVLYGINNFLDAIFVGYLINTKALAAVGMAFPLSQIVLGFGRLVGIGAGAAVSIWIGENRQDKLYKLFGSFNFLCIFFSLICTVPAYIFAHELMAMMGAKGELQTIAVEYFRVTLIGTIFWIYGLALNMLIRAEGKMKTAAMMIAIGLVIDIILKPIFISTFGMGVSGAAWATNCGMLIYSLLGFYYYAKGKSSFKTNWKSVSYNPEIGKRILKLGVPEMILSVMGVVQSIIIFNAIASYGTEDDISFFTVLNRFFLFLLTPLFGLMRGLQPVVGINFGAGQFERARQFLKTYILAGVAILSPFFLIALLFPEQLIGLMLPGYTVNASQIQDFRLFFSVLPILPITVLALSYYPAVNDSKKASFLVFLRQLILYIPLMLILPYYFGVKSIYWGSALIEVIVGVTTFIILRKGISKQKMQLT
ncbi:MATE family efflux transporter [Chryseobacterium sp. Ch-15]|uniref:Multidrug export protein MepA n=1 Tax=Chryseobacterium muglaense TaxID=2893752 RepID=A0A9Q3UYB7_9FLAO|nr:MATE family efflux transporter [Chryseobacterium muglaense]MBD3907133.1 MATE family efflux transporter [Chryseobacterium muglaense]MCC9035564.1 MATE family efflux transporter [Chryseobacterium muglaense]MCM2556796.1 MATE family efflux transporter [Chryseobacterium muglaense]